MELIPLQLINERVVYDPVSFIAECESEYDKRIKGAGDLIASDIHNRPILLLSGPSGSGKTTTAIRISEYLNKIGINSHAISIDDYFTDVDENSPRNEKGEFDFETPECVDSELLKEHIDRIYHGEEVLVPRFDFKLQKRAPEGVPTRLHLDEVVIFEGIHALNEAVTGATANIAHMLYTRVTSQVVNNNGAIFFKKSDVRLIRRTVRDIQFRGTGASETFAMWENVCAGEHKHIVPYSDNADIEIDSFLPYEIGALKDMTLQAIRSIDKDNLGYCYAKELLEKLPFFASVDHLLVPKSSILREFIGDKE